MAVGMATLVEIRVGMEAEEAMVKQVRSNSALVSDVCVAALRAFFNAPQRGRYMARTRAALCATAVFFIAAFATSAVADYKRCFQAGNTIETNECLGDELHKVNKQLQQTYNKVSKALTPETGKALEDAQQIWIQFRDKECHAVYEFWKAGTIRTTKTLVCRIEKTTGRIAELRKWPPK